MQLQLAHSDIPQGSGADVRINIGGGGVRMGEKMGYAPNIWARFGASLRFNGFSIFFIKHVSCFLLETLNALIQFIWLTGPLLLSRIFIACSTFQCLEST